MEEKKNCWEIKKCGREKGGYKEKEMGVCPAFDRHAGDACWLIAGTFCGGKVQGTFASKEASCMTCEVYKLYDIGHRSKVREKFKK